MLSISRYQLRFYVLFSSIYLDNIDGCRFFNRRTEEIILATALQICPLRDLFTLLVDRF